jgi:hypothetical protein
MTSYKASQRQWDQIKKWTVEGEGSTDNCILELLSRVENLEHVQCTATYIIRRALERLQKLEAWQ